MNIIPISAYPFQSSSVKSVAEPLATAVKAELPFKDLFQQALGNINEANALKEQDSLNLAAGDVDLDDLANYAINSQKAELSLQLLVQVRNKLLDAYQEVMRLNV